MDRNKICSKCGEEKPLSEFHRYKRRSKKDSDLRYRSYCKACHSKSMKIWSSKNREYRAAYMRNARTVAKEKQALGIAELQDLDFI